MTRRRELLIEDSACSKTASESNPELWPTIKFEELSILPPGSGESIPPRTSPQRSWTPESKEASETEGRTGVLLSTSGETIPEKSNSSARPDERCGLSGRELEKAILDRRRYLWYTSIPELSNLIPGSGMHAELVGVDERASASEHCLYMEDEDVGAASSSTNGRSHVNLTLVRLSPGKNDEAMAAAVRGCPEQSERWQKMEEDCQPGLGVEPKRLCKRCEKDWSEKMKEWSNTEHVWSSEGCCEVCLRVLDKGTHRTLHFMLRKD